MKSLTALLVYSSQKKKKLPKPWSSTQKPMKINSARNLHIEPEILLKKGFISFKIYSSGCCTFGRYGFWESWFFFLYAIKSENQKQSTKLFHFKYCPNNSSDNYLFEELFFKKIPTES